MKSFLIYHISPAYSSPFYLSVTNGAGDFVPADTGATAVSGPRRRGPLRVNPASDEARSFAFIFPLPGLLKKSSGGMMPKERRPNGGRWFCSSLLIVIPAKAGMTVDILDGGLFQHPLPGRVFRSVRSYFVIDPRVDGIVSLMRQVPLVVLLPMRRERRTRWTIPNMRRN